jgi:hypothetical protein
MRRLAPRAAKQEGYHWHSRPGSGGHRTVAPCDEVTVILSAFRAVADRFENGVSNSYALTMGWSGWALSSAAMGSMNSPL